MSKRSDGTIFIITEGKKKTLMKAKVGNAKWLVTDYWDTKEIMTGLRHRIIYLWKSNSTKSK